MAAKQATATARSLGMEARVTFRQGTFEATALDTASVDAVMSVDALQYIPDKTTALAEVARILRPDGRFALVAFEVDSERVAGLPFWDDPVSDYRLPLASVGFEVNRYDQIPNWTKQVSACFGAVLRERAALEAELGEAAAAATLMEAAVTLEIRLYCGHVLAVATRS